VTRRPSLPFVAFLQALGLTVYCGLVGVLFWKGNDLFGPMQNYWGPVLFLVLFVASALISALLVLGYPIKLFWIQKKPREALKLVVCTTAWLAFFVVLFLILLATLR